MEIEGCCAGALDIKRCYLPGIVIRSACPACRRPYEMDLARHYLSYPVIGAPLELTGYCDDCGNEWSLGKVILRVSLEEEKPGS